MFKVDISLKPSKALSNLKMADAIVKEASKVALEQASLLVISKAKEKAPRDRGTLSGSITYSIRSAKNLLESVIGTNVFYAPFLEFGTGIHGAKKRMITPKKGSFLAWQKNGQWIFARQVKGIKPKKYLKQGIDFMLSRTDTIQSVFNQKLREKL